MIAVVDYGIGNLRSAEKALQHLGADARLTTDAQEIAAADAVVLPGVGNFGACMRALQASGLEAATRTAATDGRPFLGICVGMQMLFDGSDESPGVAGLGIVAGRITRLPATVRLPQMGWNTLEPSPGSRLVAGLPGPAWCYFVHSFAPDPADVGDVAAWCEYGRRFAAAVERGPLWATQFHPEKSGDVGLALLGNFVAEESRRVTRRSRLDEVNPTIGNEESRRVTRRSRLDEANPTIGNEESRRVTRRSRLDEVNPTIGNEESRRVTRRSRLDEANPTMGNGF